MMTSQELREKFIKYFESKGHKLMSPSSLVSDDPTTLFTTAGMQQFKKYYLDPSEAPAKNIVTVQPCFRTSDIEEVGDDTHLTFFEMLGNFSFNGYGKEEAIKYGWEFLTEELKIDKSRITATVFAGDTETSRDDESSKILEDMQIKYTEQGRDDNFWSLGTENSPGGPTVEFYISPGKEKFRGAESDYIDRIEIWNLVFNEYVFRSGKYEKSEFGGVDTGMGLERLLTILNNKKNVYDTDLFENIIKKIEEISGKKYVSNTELDSVSNHQKAFRIIADHIKASVFAVNDGILPSNKDAGYIVRRLIRRSIVNANQIGITKNFVSDIVEVVFNVYKDVYDFHIDTIKNELNKEEDKFRQTLEKGLSNFEKQKDSLSGKIAFDLYQTYGFPWEMTAELAEEAKIKIDKKEFEVEFKKHQDLSRTASAGMFKGGLASGGEQETKYHTATHLLHSALRKVLGEEVEQRGSNINAERMRFDFSYPDKLTEEQIKEVESLVNENIKKDLEVNMEEMSLEDAQSCGAIGLFESKYGDKVKVYTIGNPSTSSGSRDFVSREICGGPHVKSTSELGYFKITKEESSSAGIRRIKAIIE